MALSGAHNERQPDMLTYGDITRDPAKLPAISTAALLARGFSHLLGNEQASKIVAKIRSALAEGKPDGYEATRADVQAFREANPALVSQWSDEAKANALKALDEGTLGVHVARGPSRDPIESAMHAIARGEVSEVLKSNTLKVPSGEKTVTLGGEAFTMDALIDRRLAKHGDRIRKEAERKVAESERKAKRLREESANSGAADLGL